MKTQQDLRQTHGLQCPECHGVRIFDRISPFTGFIGWICHECGCQWSADINKTKKQD